jgi:hypothetical protein
MATSWSVCSFATEIAATRLVVISLDRCLDVILDSVAAIDDEQILDAAHDDQLARRT